MKDETYSRKEFITKLFLMTGTIFSGSIFALSGCNSKKTSSKKNGKASKSKTALTNPCDDLSNVSKEEIEKRKNLGYVKKSTVAGSNCSNCQLYLAPKEGEKCGGCLLFDGPVRAEGYCMQYVPKA